MLLLKGVVVGVLLLGCCCWGVVVRVFCWGVVVGVLLECCCGVLFWGVVE